MHAVRVVAFTIAVAVVAFAWWRLDLPVTPAGLAAASMPYRHAWYAPILVIAVFVLLELVLFPVLILIAATGLVFGPVLGPLYAMAGSLVSASMGFAIGRWLGRRRVERLSGERIGRLMGRLRRNGTLTVFLARKVPVPFTLMNITVGASPVSFRDFLLGTLLGMAAAVTALAGFGSQLSQLARDPSPATLARGVLFLAVPLGMALAINHALREKVGT
jgi:phospholipase D1/2